MKNSILAFVMLILTSQAIADEGTLEESTGYRVVQTPSPITSKSPRMERISVATLDSNLLTFEEVCTGASSVVVKELQRKGNFVWDVTTHTSTWLFGHNERGTVPDCAIYYSTPEQFAASAIGRIHASFANKKFTNPWNAAETFQFDFKAKIISSLHEDLNPKKLLFGLEVTFDKIAYSHSQPRVPGEISIGRKYETTFWTNSAELARHADEGLNEVTKTNPTDYTNFDGRLSCKDSLETEIKSTMISGGYIDLPAPNLTKRESGWIYIQKFETAVTNKQTGVKSQYWLTYFPRGVLTPNPHGTASWELANARGENKCVAVPLKEIP